MTFAPESPFADKLGRRVQLVDQRGVPVTFTLIEAQPGRIGLVGPSGKPLSVTTEQFAHLFETGEARWISN